MATFQQGFSRQLRLLTPVAYQQVFQGAQGRSADECFIILARINNLDIARLGLAVSKKRLKGAAARNRVKRIVRESFRQHQALLAGLDLVVMNRDGLAAKENSALYLSLQGHWKTLVKRCKHS